MSLYRRQDSQFWWCSLTAPDGEVVQFSTKKARKIEALKVERDRAEELLRAPRKEAAGQPLSAVAAEFIAWKETQREKPNREATLVMIRKHIFAHVVPYFGAARDIRAMNDDDVLEEFRTARLQKVQAVTVNKELSTLRQIMAFAKKRKYITGPLATVKNAYHRYELNPARLLDPEELEALLVALEDGPPLKPWRGGAAIITEQMIAEARQSTRSVRDMAKEWGVHHSTLQYAIRHGRVPHDNRGKHRRREVFPHCLLRANTAIRPHETTLLRWEMVDWGKRQIHLPPSSAKTDHGRVVDLNDQAMLALRLLGDHNSTGRIFVTKTFYRAWHTAVAQAGIKGRCVPNDLRHTFGSLLHRSGASMPTVRDIMGHRTLTMANLYAHTYDADRKAAVNGVVHGATRRTAPTTAPTALQDVEKNVEELDSETVRTVNNGTTEHTISMEAQTISMRN